MKTDSDDKKKHFVIQCPKPECLCDDVSQIQWVEMYPVYSRLYKEEDGTTTINTSDGEVFWDGGSDDGKLFCSKCGTEWTLPYNCTSHINWN